MSYVERSDGLIAFSSPGVGIDPDLFIFFDAETGVRVEVPTAQFPTDETGCPGEFREWDFDELGAGRYDVVHFRADISPGPCLDGTDACPWSDYRDLGDALLVTIIVD